METKDYINKIEKVALKRAFTEADNELRKQTEIAGLELEIRHLATRIKDIVAIGVACYDNGILLGEPCGFNSKSPEFVSDSINHRFGFIVEGWEFFHDKVNHPIVCPFAIGVRGGGSDGDDFIVNTGGCVASGQNKGNYIQCLKDFLKKFPTFEAQFKEYIANLH